MREYTGTNVLDWKLASRGPVDCGREPNMSPIMRAAGDEGTGRRERKPDSSPNCRSERNWRWPFAAHRLGRCDRCEWGECVLEAGRNVWTVWPYLVRFLVKLSSSWPKSQERLDGAEAAGLSGYFRSIRLCLSPVEQWTAAGSPDISR